METVKINFCDFWKSFNTEDNYFTQLLSEDYNLKLSDKPDLVIYGPFGKQHKKYKCKRVFYTGESRKPDFNDCDFAFTFDHIDGEPRHYRLPLYVLYDDPAVLVQGDDYDPCKILEEKESFCNFIYSYADGKAQRRGDFFEKLSKYKQVDSGGRALNNIGYRVGDKIAFQRKYKFSIAFENSESDGYTTEKIFDPMRADSLPIYWGNKLVYKDFNTESFLNWHDYGSDEAIIEKIIELDKDDDKYIEMMSKPFLNDNRCLDSLKRENIKKQFEYILDNEETPIGQRGLRKYIWF